MAAVCYKCGKQIKGRAVHIVPSNLAIRMGADFPRSYHPACYAKADREAGRTIKKGR